MNIPHSKNILLLTPGFPENELDNTCIPALQDFLLYFNEHQPDCHFHVVTLHYPFKSEKYQWNDIPVASIGASNSKGVKRIYFRRRYRQLAEQIIRERSMDCIHALWLGECHRIGQKLSKKHNIPLITTCMGQDVLRSNWLSSIDEKDRIVCLSNFHKEKLVENGGDDRNVDIIPWKCRFDPDESTRNFDIIGVGSLNKVKNWSRFLDIVRLVQKKKPGTTTAIIGKHVDSGNLVDRIEREKLNVTLTGELPRPEIQGMMLNAKVLLHTSDFESFGMTLEEGLCAGLHVISTPVGMAAENNKVNSFITNEQGAEKVISALEINNSNPVNDYNSREMINAYMKLYT